MDVHGGEVGGSGPDVDRLLLARLRQIRRQNWRDLLDGCVEHDATQYAAMHQMPMIEVLPRIERWLDELYRAQEIRRKKIK